MTGAARKPRAADVVRLGMLMAHPPAVLESGQAACLWNAMSHTHTMYVYKKKTTNYSSNGHRSKAPTACCREEKTTTSPLPCQPGPIFASSSSSAWFRNCCTHTQLAFQRSEGGVVFFLVNQRYRIVNTYTCKTSSFFFVLKTNFTFRVRGSPSSLEGQRTLEVLFVSLGDGGGGNGSDLMGGR